MSEFPVLPSPERVGDTVYRAIRDAILGRRLRPGDSLSVPDLARKLGVSRSPVRDAVLQLVAEGLAWEEPRKGASVARLGADDLDEVHEVRESLEGLAARLCASRISPEELSGLMRVLDDQAEAVARGDGDAYRETDRRFHEKIARSCGNGRLERFLGALHGQMRVALRIAAASREHIEKGHREHRAVLDAIEARDAGRAEELMRAHIARTRTQAMQANTDADKEAPKGG